MQYSFPDDDTLIERDKEENERFRRSWFLLVHLRILMPAAAVVVVLALGAAALHYAGQ